MFLKGRSCINRRINETALYLISEFVVCYICLCVLIIVLICLWFIVELLSMYVMVLWVSYFLRKGLIELINKTNQGDRSESI